MRISKWGQGLNEKRGEFIKLDYKLLISLWFLVFNGICGGAELYNSHTNVRALGMGNAYVSVVSDSESLFYNPAGLAKVSGFFWRLMDPRIGLSGLEAFDKVSNLEGDSGFAQTVRDLYGSNIFVGGGGQTAIITPFVTASLYYDASASIYVGSPSNPELALNYISDTGVAFGFGFHILPFFQMGLAFRSFKRTGIRKVYGISELGALDSSIFTDDLKNSGTGLGMDLGFNIAIDTFVSPTISFVWRNIGVTSIEPDASTTVTPPDEPEEMIVGASIGVHTPIVSVTPSADFRYLNRSDVQIGKKINLGLEFDFPFVSVRGGFSEGYYSAGATLGLGLLQVDAATWGVELGEAPGQIEDRRYMVQVTLELGFDLGSGSSGGSGRGGKGKSGGGSSRRLKRRR